MRAISYELELNQANADKIDQILQHLQQTDPEAAHYILNIYSTDPWDAALDEQIIDNVNEELQSTYTEIKRLNELIKRLRTESLHPELGETRGSGGYGYPLLSTSLVAWEATKEEVGQTPLGPLIRERSLPIIRSIPELLGLLEEEIGR